MAGYENMDIRKAVDLKDDVGRIEKESVVARDEPPTLTFPRGVPGGGNKTGFPAENWVERDRDEPASGVRGGGDKNALFDGVRGEGDNGGPAGGSERGGWKASLAGAVRDADELCDLLELPEDFREGARRAAKLFPLVVPRGFVSRMRKGDVADPLLRQVLPVVEEGEEVEGFIYDPVSEHEIARLPGFLQKYPGRALLITTPTCAVNCRYCFRRHFPYDETPRGLAAWEPALKAIASDATIHEVILSGGDPLTLVDERLSQLAERLSAIPHLQRLRVHSRLPIVIPERVDDPLICWMTGTRLTPIMVVHANHPNELDTACSAAIGRLVDAGIPVLNQAVLLKGINDSAAVLEDLCERLVDMRVMPYYLHLLDRVAGAAHFDVPEKVGRQLIDELRRRLPGYAVPTLVREVAGLESKLPV